MDILEEARKNIDIMRKYKRTNRMINSVKVVMSEDAFAQLMATGQLVTDTRGKYYLDNVEVVKVLGYPDDYVAAE